MSDHFTIRELSRLWLVSVVTIRRWITTGILAARRSSVGHVVGLVDRVRFERTDTWRARPIDRRAGMRPRHSGFAQTTTARARRRGLR